MLSSRRAWSGIAFVLFAAGFGLFGVNQRVSAALGIWGMVALFAYSAWIGISSSDRRWVEAKGLLKFGLVSIVAGSASFSVGAIAQLLGESILIVALVDSIAGTCALMGIGATIFAFLVAQPQPQGSVQA